MSDSTNPVSTGGSFAPDPTNTHPIVRCQDGRFESLTSLTRIAVLSGAFNPIHDGHWQLSDVAERLLQRPVHFELSLINVDKPDLDDREVQRRIAPIDRRPVLLTRAPRFLDKAELFPDSWFIVGFDTALRILDPRYYQKSGDLRDDALQKLRLLGARFLVAGRMIVRSEKPVYAPACELPVPAGFKDLFNLLPESEFRVDLSSTDVRRQQDV